MLEALEHDDPRITKGVIVAPNYRERPDAKPECACPIAFMCWQYEHLENTHAVHEAFDSVRWAAGLVGERDGRSVVQDFCVWWDTTERALAFRELADEIRSNLHDLVYVDADKHGPPDLPRLETLARPLCGGRAPGEVATPGAGEHPQEREGA